MRELGNLRKWVNDLEIELRGRHRRRDWEDPSDDPNYIVGESSQGSGLCQSRDRPCETIGCYCESPHRERFRNHNAAMDAMSWALRRAI